MSDNYQAVYDAVRSHFHIDAAAAVEAVVRHAERFAQEFGDAAQEHQRPSAVFRPALSIDGNQWCALYGGNLQDGVAGFGNSPEDAMRDFDSQWVRQLTQGINTSCVNNEYPKGGTSLY